MRLSYLIALALLSPIANAATFNVSTTPELREALATAATNGEGDTIILSEGTYKTTDDALGGFVYYSDESYSLIIKSDNNSVLDGVATDPILYIRSPKAVTLENLTFQNGYSKTTAGALFAESSTIITKVSFNDNQSDDYGGAIKFEGTNLEIYESTFNDNTSEGDGGSIYASEPENIVIDDSTFNRNNSNRIGGAISIISHYGAVRTTLNNSTFKNNSSSGSGGGVFILTHDWSDDKKINITNSNFINNTSGQRGGCIHVEQTKITGSTFSGCQSGLDGNASWGWGGAILGWEIEVENSTFLNNSASLGGAIYTSEISLNESKFFNNSSSGKEGEDIHIAFFQNKDEPIITNSIFSNKIHSAGINVYSEQTISIVNSLFKNAEVQSTADHSVIINSIFMGGSEQKLQFDDFSNPTLNNNYINLEHVSGFVSTENTNVYEGINLGFSDELNNDFSLQAESDFIDAGSTNNIIELLPENDIGGFKRITGGSIDIGPYEYQYSDHNAFILLDDINHDGIKDHGVFALVGEERIPRLYRYSGDIRGELIDSLEWSPNYRTAKVQLIADTTGDEVAEIALFGLRNDGINTGKWQAVVLDGARGNKVSTFNWVANWSDSKLIELDDLTRDGVNEIALSGRFKDGNRPQLFIRDGASSVTKVAIHSYPDNWDDAQYIQLGDHNDDGVNDIGLFGISKKKGRGQIKLKSGSDGSNLPAYNFPAKWNDMSLERIGDVNGDDVEDIALFGQAIEDGRWQLITKKGNTRKGSLGIFSWPNDIEGAKFVLTPDMDGDGVKDFGVFGKRGTKFQLRIKSGADRNITTGFYNFADKWGNPEIIILPDSNGDGLVEFGVFGKDRATDNYQLTVMNGDTEVKTLLRTYSFGSNWVKPQLRIVDDINGDGVDDILFYSIDKASQQASFTVYSGTDAAELKLVTVN